MGLLPQSLVGKIQFFESHLTDWQAHAVAIGCTVAEISALQTNVESARAALTDQENAQSVAKTKTAALRDAVDAMLVLGSAAIIHIRAKAQTDGNSIYQLANIPAPATPTPIGPPGTPNTLKVALNGNGAVNLAWKCPNPTGSTGTLYQVWRQIGEAGTLEYLGGSGSKSFIDDTLPAGSMNVMYQIQAVRSTAVGQFATFNVKFGVGGGVMSIASVEETTKKKAA